MRVCARVYVGARVCLCASARICAGCVPVCVRVWLRVCVSPMVESRFPTVSSVFICLYIILSIFYSFLMFYILTFILILFSFEVKSLTCHKRNVTASRGSFVLLEKYSSSHCTTGASLLILWHFHIFPRGLYQSSRQLQLKNLKGRKSKVLSLSDDIYQR